MAILTKAQLQAANSASFPNNNSQAITPQILRDYNSSVIDTLVDSLDTGSFARTDITNDFTQTNNFTSISASAFVSASNFIGDGSKLTNITASTALPILDEGILQGYATSMNFTGSAISASVIAGTAVVQVNIEGAGFVTTASFNSFTSSTNQFTQSASSSISQLNASSASQQISINALNVYTASQSTASIVNSIDSLNTFTQSQEVFNSVISAEVTALEIATASLFTSVSNLNQSSASQQVSINALNAYTASQSGSFVTTSSFNSYTASNDSKVNQLIAKTGSYATTGSNTFNGLQTINSQLIVDTGGNQLILKAGDSGSTVFAQAANSSLTIFQSNGADGIDIYSNVDISGSLTASLQQGYVWVGNASGVSTTVATSSLVVNVNTGSLVTTASFNQYTQSNDQRVSSLEVNSASVNTSVTNLNLATSSLFTSASLGLVTASAVGNTITFTKGDTSTFNVSVSSTPIDTSSFATTGSNTFIGDQTISGSLFVSGSEVLTGTLSASALRVENNTYLDGNLTVTNDTLINGDVTIQSATPNLKLRDTSGGGFSSGYDLRVDTGSFEIYDDTHNRDVLSDFFNSASQQHTTSLTSEIIVISGSTSVTLIGNVSASIISASTINGLGNPLTFSTSVDSRLDSLEGITASVNTSASLALYTASFDTGSRNLTFTKGDTTTFAVNIPDVSGSTIDTGSFATTGSNVFTGDQTLIDASGNRLTLTDVSGSLMLVGTGYNSSSLHISASATGSGNLIFKFNDITTDTIISGSGNIFSNQLAATAGFKKYIGGNQNIFAGVSSVPQISGSMAFPVTMNTNFAAGTFSMRGPVSSSTWSILQNNILGTLNLGSSAVLNAEKLTSGLSFNGNYVAGTVSIIANQSALTGSTTTLSGNNINGTVGIALSSSAVTFSNNTINDGGFALINQYYSSSVGLGTVTAQRNTIAGNTNTIFVSGALATGTTAQPQFNDNFIGGAGNILYSEPATARVSGLSSGNSFYKSIIYGQSLIVSASMLGSETNAHGAAFFGRFNSTDGNKDLGSDTIFAVGTGISGSRKTGFLIDSGSNTFIEGTLNVSGATSLNGNLNITGSLTASLQEGFVYVGNASGITTTVATSSFGGGTIPAGTISSSAQITDLGFVSSSVTASSLVTASVNLNTITFTKGDSSTFSLTVDTGSGGGGAAFPFVGDAVITGSLTVSGSAIPDIRLIGNIEVTGSIYGQPITLSVASSTASLDMRASNSFILNIPTGSTTHIVPTNIIAGQTVNLLLKQAAGATTGSVAWSPLILFPSGYDLVATQTGSAIDLVSMISFDTTNLMAANVKNLK
jgi:hypothetical protein